MNQHQPDLDDTSGAPHDGPPPEETEEMRDPAADAEKAEQEQQRQLESGEESPT